MEIFVWGRFPFFNLLYSINFASIRLQNWFLGHKPKVRKLFAKPNCPSVDIGGATTACVASTSEAIL